jgi:MFS family permease
LPYLAVAAMSALCALGFAWMAPPPHVVADERAGLGDLLRVRAVAVCAIAVVLGGGTLAMLEPTLSLFLAEQVGLGPTRIGLVFGAGAVVSAMLHPVFGRIADRAGGRPLMMIGLTGIGVLLPILAGISSFESGLVLNALFTVAVATMMTPSLAYMADAISTAGVQSYGVAYGVYNFAWALGLLVGPSIGGAGYERIGFARLTVAWAVALLLSTAIVWYASSGRSRAVQV